MSVSPWSGISVPVVQTEIFKGDTAPTEGAIGDLWIDTSSNPASLMVCTDPAPVWVVMSSGGGGPTFFYYMEDGSSKYLMEDGSSFYLTEQ
jgi:hypothetical protein